jgi:hypothetical protein
LFEEAAEPVATTTAATAEKNIVFMGSDYIPAHDSSQAPAAVARQLVE